MNPDQLKQITEIGKELIDYWHKKKMEQIKYKKVSKMMEQ